MTFPKRPLLTAGVALLAAALNAQSTALTWRHETVSYPTPRAPGIPSNLAVDDSENVYVVINDPSQEGPTALRKYDMFGNVFIAPPLPFSTDVADTLRVCASPTIAGQQYVYVLEFPAAPNGAVNAQKYLCTNRQVPPSSVWTAPFHFSAPNGYAWQPAGCYIDSQGLIYLALGLEGDSHHTSHELKLLKLDANGRILRNFDVPLIAPGDDPVELSGYLPRAHQDLYERAAFSPGLHKWIIEGDSLIGGFLTTSARWGVYD